jgi:F420-non-reducing hydrogenase small subunit
MSQGEELFGSVYERGEVVFRQGEPGNSMYVIQSGAVEVTQRRGNKHMVLALLERGNFFGEIALIVDVPRSATVTAICRTRLLPLTRSALLKRLRQDPSVALHLLKALSHRIEKADQRLRSIIDTNETLRPAVEKSREEMSQKSFAGGADVLPAELDEKSSPPYLATLRGVDEWANSKNSVSFAPGQIVFREGQPGDAMYIIAKGSVEISKGEGKDKSVLACLGTNEIFGEMSLITRRTRSATVSARVHSRLLPVRRDDFLDVVKVRPELALHIIQVLIIRLLSKEGAALAPKESLHAFHNCLQPVLRKEPPIRVALIPLSTCSGCLAMLLKEKSVLDKFMEQVSISYCPMIMDSQEIGEADLSIVEGAVRLEEDVEKLREARTKSRYLVAWGSCAVFGGIPAMANQCEIEELIKESYSHTHDPFDHYLSGTGGVRPATYQGENLALLRQASNLSSFVRVDYCLPGCPPPLHLLMHIIKELRGESQALKSHKIVCTECNRKQTETIFEHFRVFPLSNLAPNHCFPCRGVFCLGLVTRGGCGAECPRSGLPCWGCRGPSRSALNKMGRGHSFEQIALRALSRRSRLAEEEIKPVIRIARRRGMSAFNFEPGFILSHSRLR